MRTIPLDEEAYGLLCAAKRFAQESFSSVVKRTFRPRPNLRDAFGGWGDVSDERVAAFRRERDAIFGETDR